MGILKTILAVIFILICLALTVVILMQEGKSAGLGAIAGAADTYWGKNKGRSMEGMLVKMVFCRMSGCRVRTAAFLHDSGKNPPSVISLCKERELKK